MTEEKKPLLEKKGSHSREEKYGAMNCADSKAQKVFKQSDLIRYISNFLPAEWRMIFAGINRRAYRSTFKTPLLIDLNGLKVKLTQQFISVVLPEADLALAEEKSVFRHKLEQLAQAAFNYRGMNDYELNQFMDALAHDESKMDREGRRQIYKLIEEISRQYSDASYQNSCIRTAARTDPCLAYRIVNEPISKAQFSGFDQRDRLNPLSLSSKLMGAYKGFTLGLMKLIFYFILNNLVPSIIIGTLYFYNVLTVPIALTTFGANVFFMLFIKLFIFSCFNANPEVSLFKKLAHLLSTPMYLLISIGQYTKAGWKLGANNFALEDMGYYYNTTPRRSLKAGYAALIADLTRVFSVTESASICPTYYRQFFDSEREKKQDIHTEQQARYENDSKPDIFTDEKVSLQGSSHFASERVPSNHRNKITFFQPDDSNFPSVKNFGQSFLKPRY